MRKSYRLSIVFMALALLLVVLTGCAEMQGDVNANQAPNVDFVNVHDNSASIIYDYAPVIQWRGNDPDGFVDHYSFADITDSAAILDPLGYIDLIPEEVWKDTIATSARIFLLSSAGDTTEHVFYVRCTDNEGRDSDVSYRTFFRTNRPPDVPIIGVTGEDETNYAPRRVITGDTLFSAPEITSTYPGLSFSWRGSDPDDKNLFKIPLEFQAILVKSPSDTVFVRNWSDDTDIVLSDLETGNYTLNVWSRDDGFTTSVNPARIEFYVIRPTFEHNLLVVMEATNTDQVANLPSSSNIAVYYDELLRDVEPQLQNVNLEFDGVDVRFILVTEEFTDGKINLPSRALISQYKMVMFIQDQFRYSNFGPNYISAKTQILDDYLEVGGRVWVMGRMIGDKVLEWSSATRAELRDVFLRYFGVNNIVYPQNWVNPGGQALAIAECIGTVNAIDGFPELVFDDQKTGENWIRDYLANNYGLSGVERIERTAAAETMQYIKSNTAGSLIDVLDENSAVREFVTINGVQINYPPSPTACYLMTDNIHVEEVTSVENVTLMEAGAVNAIGEVIFVNNNIVFVSYDEGQPWKDTDSLRVDYSYDPISEYHLKPCAVRYEGVDASDVFSELRFRTALTTYSPYFMKRDKVVEEFVLMLDWFFNPELNSAAITIMGKQ